MITDTNDAHYRASIFPLLPFDSLFEEGERDQWGTIYFHFGQALLWAQAYEDGLAQLIIAAEERWYRSGIAAEKIWKMTLGQLHKELARYCHLEPHHHDRMNEVLEARNAIAHNFYRRRLTKLQTAEGREQVIRELQEACCLFQGERDDAYWLLSGLADWAAVAARLRSFVDHDGQPLSSVNIPNLKNDRTGPTT